MVSAGAGNPSEAGSAFLEGPKIDNLRDDGFNRVPYAFARQEDPTARRYEAVVLRNVRAPIANTANRGWTSLHFERSAASQNA